MSLETWRERDTHTHTHTHTEGDEQTSIAEKSLLQLHLQHVFLLASGLLHKVHRSMELDRTDSAGIAVFGAEDHVYAILGLSTRIETILFRYPGEALRRDRFPVIAKDILRACLLFNKRRP
jgi:hypothetical protein